MRGSIPFQPLSQSLSPCYPKSCWDRGEGWSVKANWPLQKKIFSSGTLLNEDLFSVNQDLTAMETVAFSQPINVSVTEAPFLLWRRGGGVTVVMPCQLSSYRNAKVRVLTNTNKTNCNSATLATQLRWTHSVILCIINKLYLLLVQQYTIDSILLLSI